MKKYTSLLRWIWLWEKPSHIYLALLEHWTCNITEIQLHTNLHRAEIYRFIPILLEKQLLIVSTQWKRKLYSPASPIKIQEAYREQEELNKGSIEQLLNKYSHLNKKPRVIYWEWEQSITNVFHDIIDTQNTWDIFYRITSEKDSNEINEKYLPKNYRQKRDKKDLERYVIMSSQAWSQKQARLERDLKLIPKEIDEFNNNVFMSIYANKVAFIDFNNESSIIIENQQIADFQKSLFKLLYKKL